MYKKLTFLFVTTFVIALVFFSSYFVIQEVRGVNIGGILEMNNHSISNLGPPTDLSDLVTKGYLKNVGNFYLGADSINSWCEVQGFSWCTSGYVVCGDGICNGDETYTTCSADCPPPGGNGDPCFTAETQILMADGSYKQIKDVKEGDWILTKENESSDKMVSAKVIKTSEQTTDSYLIINNKLEVTGNHPIFIGGKWKQAQAIELGDKLFNEKGQEVIVESLELKKETVKVYNIELEDYQAYFAGGFYVHNLLKNGELPL